MAVVLRRRRPSAGFSLIEVFIAAAIFLTIALGILPFFSLSMRNNRSGAESTELANLARSRLEEFFQMPFDAPDLTLDAGMSDKTFEDYYSQATEQWVDCGPPPCPPVADPGPWQRTTIVRQYSISALDDGVLDPATEALPDTAPAGAVHIKEIVVQIQGVRLNSLFGPPKRLTLRTIKSS